MPRIKEDELCRNGLCICLDRKCEIPRGDCHCGCGGKTRVAKYSEDCGTYWSVAGVPSKFIHGHQRRKSYLRPRPTPFRYKGKLRCLIPLTHGLVAMIDYADLDLVWRYAWVAHKGARDNWYARTYLQLPSGKFIYPLMHRMIMGVTDPKIEVDHRDNNDTLNNTRENLRMANKSQQGCNSTRRKPTTGYRGVARNNSSKSESYTSNVFHHGIRHYCGTYSTAIEAARARDRKAMELHGEFVVLNFPRSSYTDVAVQSSHAGS